MTRVCVFSPKPTFGKRIHSSRQFLPTASLQEPGEQRNTVVCSQHYYLRWVLHIELQIQHQGAAHSRGGEKSSGRLRLYVYKKIVTESLMPHVKHDHFVYKILIKLTETLCSLSFVFTCGLLPQCKCPKLRTNYYCSFSYAIFHHSMQLLFIPLLFGALKNIVLLNCLIRYVFLETKKKKKTSFFFHKHRGIVALHESFLNYESILWTLLGWWEPQRRRRHG